MKLFGLTIMTIALLLGSTGIVALRVNANRVRANVGDPFSLREEWATAGRSLALFVGGAILTIAVAVFGDFVWGWTALVWAFVVIVMVIAGVFMAPEYPANRVGNFLHDAVWGKPADPANPDSTPAVGPAFWVQLICMALLTLSMGILLAVSAISSGFSGTPSDKPADQPTATAPATPDPEPTPAPEKDRPTPAPERTTPTLQPTTPATMAPVKEKCVSKDWLVKYDTPQPSKLLDTTGVEQCVGGYWQPWSGPAPGDISAIASARQGPYQIALFRWKGEDVMIRWIVAS